MRDVERRRQRDHERYLRQRDERLERQRAYYQANRETLLRKAKNRYIKQQVIACAFTKRSD